MSEKIFNNLLSQIVSPEGRIWLSKRLHQNQDRGVSFNENDIQNIIDWFNFKFINDKKFVTKFSKISFNDAMISQEKWHKSFNKNKRKFITDNNFVIIKEFMSSYICKIINQEGLQYESDMMNHCVSSYSLDDYDIYSYRNENNKPILTISFCKQSRIQIKEFANKPISLKNFQDLYDFLKEECLKRNISLEKLHSELEENFVLYKDNVHSLLDFDFSLDTLSSEISEEERPIVMLKSRIRKENIPFLKREYYNKINVITKNYERANLFVSNNNDIIKIDNKIFNIAVGKDVDIVTLDINNINIINSNTIKIYGNLKKLIILANHSNVIIEYDSNIPDIQIDAKNQSQIFLKVKNLIINNNIRDNSDDTSIVICNFDKCVIEDHNFSKNNNYYFHNSIIRMDKVFGKSLHFYDMNIEFSLQADYIFIKKCDFLNKNIVSKSVYLESIDMKNVKTKINCDSIYYNNCVNVKNFKYRNVYLNDVYFSYENMISIKSNKIENLMIENCSEKIFLKGFHKDLTLRVENSKVFLKKQKKLTLEKLFVFNSVFQSESDIYCDYLGLSGNIQKNQKDNQVVLKNIYANNILLSIEYQNLTCQKLHSYGSFLIYDSLDDLEGKDNVFYLNYESIHADWYIYSSLSECLSNYITLDNGYFLSVTNKEWKQNKGYLSLYDNTNFLKHLTQDDGKIYCHTLQCPYNKLEDFNKKSENINYDCVVFPYIQGEVKEKIIPKKNATLDFHFTEDFFKIKDLTKIQINFPHVNPEFHFVEKHLISDQRPYGFFKGI